jgi:hypothetical protein
MATSKDGDAIFISCKVNGTKGGDNLKKKNLEWESF